MDVVVSAATINGVVAAFAVESTSGTGRDVARLVINRVIASAAIDDIFAIAKVDLVITVTAIEQIVATASIDRVVSGEAMNDIAAGTAIDRFRTARSERNLECLIIGTPARVGRADGNAVCRRARTVMGDIKVELT